MKKLILLIILIFCIWLPCSGSVGVSFVGASMGGGAAAGYTVSYVGTASGTDNDGTVTATPNASTASGDLMVAYLLSDTETSQSITWPLGWSATITSVTSSSSIAYIATKTAGADETGSYDFVVSQTGGEIVTLTTFRKNGGTWSVTDNDVSSATGTTLDSTAVDIGTGAALYISWGCDDAYAFNGTPDGMTDLGHAGVYYAGTTIRMRDYYQLYAGAANGVTKTNTVGTSGDLSTIALVIGAI